MTGILAVDLAVGLTAIAGALAIAVKILRVLKRLGDLIDDWNGESERPGVPGRPGVMLRLSSMEDRQQAIEAELHPNHGSTLRDAVDRVSAAVVRLEERFDEHLSQGDI